MFGVRTKEEEDEVTQRNFTTWSVLYEMNNVKGRSDERHVEL